MKRLIVCADDFGLDPAVNEAVERACRDGILTCASLMVGAPAAGDAVGRARRLAGLRVGLHIVLVDGRPILPAEAVPDLVDRSGGFDNNMARAGLRFALRPTVRRQLRREIEAQFAAFAATGLTLDHVNAHKHFHLHPTIAGLIIEIGRKYGMRALRIPTEPTAILERAGERLAPGARLGAAALGIWTAALRRRAARAGLASNDYLFGIAWTGAVTEQRLLALVPHLPEGTSEIYAHPAAAQGRPLTASMSAYRHDEELAAFVSPTLRRRIAEAGVALIGYGDLAG